MLHLGEWTKRLFPHQGPRLSDSEERQRTLDRARKLCRQALVLEAEVQAFTRPRRRNGSDAAERAREAEVQAVTRPGRRNANGGGHAAERARGSRA